jgi:hypothetical protein
MPLFLANIFGMTNLDFSNLYLLEFYLLLLQKALNHIFGLS